MHKYLRAIGFKDISQRELDKIVYEAGKTPDSYEITIDSDGNEFSEIRMEFAKRIGITMRGKYDENDEFHPKQLFPYFEGEITSIDDEIQIIRESERESYMGLCEDERLNFDLIFHLQNILAVMHDHSEHKSINAQVALTGLSVSGKIILPIVRTQAQIQKANNKSNNKKHLIEAAKEGDPEAYEKLTLSEMDTFSMLSKRIGNEDVLTIVDSFFMPTGIENDKYYLMGEIKEVTKVVNQMTYETVYQMEIESNGITFEICINEEDLLGEPEVGRRFKGNVWFQGRILDI